MNSRREKVTVKAFNSVARDGKAAFSDIAAQFNVGSDPDYQKGTKTQEQVIAEFLSNFPEAKGVVSRQEFLDYYTDLSMTVTKDDHYVAIVEKAWSIYEDTDAGVSKTQLEDLTRALRLKLKVITNQNLEEYVLKKIFNDFDTNNSGTLTLDELQAMLHKLQLHVEPKYSAALFKLFDKNNDEAIDFDEFVQYVVYDPYR